MTPQPGFNRRALIRGGMAATAAGAIGLGAAESASARPFSARSSKARPAAAEPRVYTTAEWGAQAPTEDIVVLDRVPTYIVVHHTADPGNSEDYSLEHAKEIARSIQSAHIARGFGDSGQQFTNSRGGYVLEGRHQSLGVVQGGTQHVQGAHVGDHNSETIGIENEGIYVDVDVPQALWDSLVDLVAWIATQYNRPVADIMGHRDFNSTECPGTVLYGRLQELRDAVAGAMGVAKVSAPAVWPLLRPNAVGPQVRAAQHLLRAKGFSDVGTSGVLDAATQRAVVKLTETHRIEQHTCSATYHSTVDETGYLGSDIWPLITPEVRPGENEDVAAAVETMRRAGARTSAGAFTRSDWKRLLA
ncbi:N-acetylmuramoyl-L-alanine amidase [Streptomyces sp. YIM 130001]|uniref:peptidoglycan recognition protein family protein n=1 Tax=Streptomyces sp. YIM 130001 TaxID=2259644 RepID=UPI000E646778|nr:N-acetylmuramoyl-L-alanine amidase [Streptomyces sp. YIM 130001]RII20478.1 N-acetylmuramoyl-L-alanine amidase [Streptomyces sp. YIM 130001]